MFEQPEDIAIDRFLPEPLPLIKAAADADRVNAGIEGPCEESKKATLAPADHTDGGVFFSRILYDPVDCRQHLLDLVAGKVTPQLERRPVEKLPVGQAAAGDVPIDNGRYENGAAAFRQAAGEL